MKNIIVFLIVCALAFSSSGCSVFRSGGSPDGKVDISKVVRYLEPASYFACKTLLNKATDDTDRYEKSKIVFSISSNIRALAKGSLPTTEELESAIALVTPKKIHWLEFISELSMVYERFYENAVKTEQNALMFEALGEIAEGCERAAKPYISVSEYDNYVFSSVEPFEMGRALMRPRAYRVMGVERAARIED